MWLIYILEFQGILILISLCQPILQYPQRHLQRPLHHHVVLILQLWIQYHRFLQELWHLQRQRLGHQLCLNQGQVHHGCLFLVLGRRLWQDHLHQLGRYLLLRLQLRQQLVQRARHLHQPVQSLLIYLRQQLWVVHQVRRLNSLRPLLVPLHIQYQPPYLIP